MPLHPGGSVCPAGATGWGVALPVPDAPRVPLAAVPIDARIKVPAGPGWLGVGFGSVWISKSKSRAVYRIDPSTNKVIARIPVGRDAELGVTTASGSVWIPDT